MRLYVTRCLKSILVQDSHHSPFCAVLIEPKCSPMCFIIAGDTSSAMSCHGAEKEWSRQGGTMGNTRRRQSGGEMGRMGSLHALPARYPGDGAARGG